MHTPSAGISCISLVSVFNEPTIWCGSQGLVSIWDAKTKRSIKSHILDNKDVRFLVEIGTNSVLACVGDKLLILDANSRE